MLGSELRAAGERVGRRLHDRGETIGVAEGSCGGLISAALLAVPGASSFYRGGGLIYTGAAVRAFIAPAGVAAPDPLRGASEPFVRYLAESVQTALRSTWGVGEGGATGPTGNPYGDPAGHCWVAVHGPSSATRHILTGDDDRFDNMQRFAIAALALVESALD